MGNTASNLLGPWHGMHSGHPCLEFPGALVHKADVPTKEAQQRATRMMRFVPQRILWPLILNGPFIGEASLSPSILQRMYLQEIGAFPPSSGDAGKD